MLIKTTIWTVDHLMKDEDLDFVKKSFKTDRYRWADRQTDLKTSGAAEKRMRE